MLSSIQDFNTQHSESLLIGSDEIKELFAIDHITDNGFVFNILPEKDDINNNKSFVNKAIEFYNENIQTPFVRFFHTVYSIIFMIGLIVTTVSGVLLYLKFRKIGRAGNLNETIVSSNNYSNTSMQPIRNRFRKLFRRYQRTRNNTESTYCDPLQDVELVSLNNLTHSSKNSQLNPSSLVLPNEQQL